MATITEGMWTAEAIVSEAENGRSRDAVTVLSGQNLVANSVVGKVTIAGIGRASVPAVVGTGNGAMSLVTAGADAQVGSYVVTCTAIATHGGTFSVVAPDGTALPSLTLTASTGATTAYASSHINFSITDGSTDFIVGDVFTIVVGTTAPTVLGGTGTGTISALSLSEDATTGTYIVINREAITNGGRFEVIAPDGTSLGDNFLMSAGSGTATAFTSRHINFTLTDATDFIAGNYFNVAVYKPAAAAKAVAWDPTPSTWDGRQTPAGVLYAAVDASAADVVGVLLARDAQVNAAELQWLTGLTVAEKTIGKAGLAALGIIAR